MSHPGRDRPDQLGRQVRTGLIWSFVNNVLGRLGTMLSGVILARILEPADFGVFGVALIALNLAMSLNDAGIASGLVRWPGRFEDIAPTAVTVVFGSSLLWFAATYLSAPALAAQFSAPAATPVLRLLAVAVVIDGAFAVPTAALTRSFLQGRRLTADLVNTGVSTVLTIALALLGFGPWSLAWGRIAGNAASGVVILALAPGRWRPGLDRAKARELLAFGAPLMGTSLLVFAMLNLDNIVVGRLLGAEALAFYALAFNLSSWPVFMFAFAARRVSLAGFAQLVDDPARLSAAFLRAIGLLMAFAVPFCVLLCTLAEPAVRVVYGDKWVAAVQALRWLALASIVRVFAEVSFDLLIAWGRARTVLALQLLWVVALVPALLVGVHLDGIRGAGLAGLVVGVVVVSPGFVTGLRRCGISTRALAGSLARPALGGLAAAAVSLGLAATIDGALAQALLAGAGGMAAHLVVVAPMRRQLAVSGPAPSSPAA